MSACIELSTFSYLRVTKTTRNSRRVGSIVQCASSRIATVPVMIPASIMQMMFRPAPPSVSNKVPRAKHQRTSAPTCSFAHVLHNFRVATNHSVLGFLLVLLDCTAVHTHHLSMMRPSENWLRCYLYALNLALPTCKITEDPIIKASRRKI